MKRKYYFIITLVFLFSKVFCQSPDSFSITFENDNWKNYISFDTTGDTNIWTIGKPKGILFNQTWEGENAIFTDKSLVSSYPNKSSFTLICPLTYNNHVFDFGFYFKSFIQDGDSFQLDLEIYGSTASTFVVPEKWEFNSKTLGFVLKKLPPFNDTIAEWIYCKFIYDFHTIHDTTVTLIFSYYTNENNPTSGFIIDSFFFTSQVVSIEENELLTNYSIYPNPVKSELHIQSANPQSGTIELIDIYGRVCLRIDMYHSGFQSVDVSNLQKGIYFLRIKDEVGVQNKEIFINY